MGTLKEAIAQLKKEHKGIGKFLDLPFSTKIFCVGGALSLFPLLLMNSEGAGRIFGITIILAGFFRLVEWIFGKKNKERLENLKKKSPLVKTFFEKPLSDKVLYLGGGLSLIFLVFLNIDGFISTIIYTLALSGVVFLFEIVFGKKKGK